MPCGIAVCTSEGRIVSANQRLTDWVNPTQNRPLEGEMIATLFSKAGQIYFQTHVSLLIAVQGYISEIAMNLRRPERDYLPVFLSAQTIKDADENLDQIIFAIFDASDRQTYERELNFKRQKAQELASLLDISPDAIVTIDANHRLQSWNPAAKRLFGYSQSEILDKHLRFLFGDEQGEELLAAIKLEKNGTFICETVCLASDGTEIPVELNVSLGFEHEGKMATSVLIIRDITQRKIDENSLKVLMREVDHRSKNLLAIVQSIARQTKKHSSSEQFLQTFNERIDSLAQNQTMLVENNWTGMGLSELVTAQIRHLETAYQNRFVTSGPQVWLAPRAAQAVGMALFELSTNAIKYGAASNDTGVVTINWQKNGADSDHLVLSWIETGGPSVLSPKNTGFGSQVICGILESQLEAKVDTDFLESGFSWQLTVSLANLLR